MVASERASERGGANRMASSSSQPASLATTATAATATTFPPTRQEMRRSRLASMQAAAPPAAASASSAEVEEPPEDVLAPKAEHTQDASLFRLGTSLLESVVLLLNFEEAQACRQTCRAMRQVTMEQGFTRLWCLAHKADVRAKADLARMKRDFAALDAEYTLEAETQPAPGSEWTRILPPRPKRKAPLAVLAPTPASSSGSTSPSSDSSLGFDRYEERRPQSAVTSSSSSSRTPHSSAGATSAVSGHADKRPAWRAGKRPASRASRASTPDPCAQLQHLHSHFAAVDAFELETIERGVDHE